MVQIKSFNSTSLAKVLGLMYLILAVIISPVVLLMVSAEDGALDLTESILVIIVIVLFYGIVGVIGGFLIGVIYNFIAKKFGGIELEIETI
jgi:hypothetical protein